MSTQTLDLTVVGWIGTEPKIFHESDGGVPYATFRLGSTRRWFDKGAGAWRDAQTEWFHVKVFRAMAVNSARSLRKGDPVIVQGQLSTEEWAGPEGPRTTLVLDAVALGPNLAFGSSHFARTVNQSAAAGSDEAPADVTELEELADDDELGAPPADDVAPELALAAAG
ncbi:single-stranded DNA-binding protein [Cellulomonas sp. ICMP 17802]|uniref:single-stranded DNA-binding protein n=1 Tax=Cellulomonas sp. ICMP 17802 TaxID=3239199 RepID=UPI00351BE108